MKFDTEGTYTLQYKAVDECGNETVEDREVIVANPRTVLYTDGTFIIDEQPQDMARNTALHGEATNVYPAFNPNGTGNEDRYDFVQYDRRPWNGEKYMVRRVEIGAASPFTATRFWFQGFENCTSFDLSNLTTNTIQNMQAMFEDCRVVESIDFSMVDTSKIGNFNFVFANCYKLKTVDLSNNNFSKARTFEGTFSGCEEIETISLGHGAGSLLGSTKKMFYQCYLLRSINFNDLQTNNVTDMSDMFSSCYQLASLDLSSFDTSNVTSMSGMISYCNNLQSVDLSSFDTANVTNMYRMFNSDSKLEKIYVSNAFVVSQVTNSSGMFKGCSRLVGGSGTPYSSSYVDKTYARIDNPPDAPGYFTLKQA